MKFLPHQIKLMDQARPILATHGVVVMVAECRLGKSFMALQLAREFDGGGKILFITKKKALGSVRIDAESLGVEIVAINYESLHNLKGGPFSVVICDEFHRVGSLPKPCKAAKQIRALTGGAKSILLSATPAIETGAQWFHSFWVTNRGPWKSYGSFYRWHKDFGIEKTIRIAGGQEVKAYDEVRPEVLQHALKYCVSMTQAEAGFSQRAEVIVHRIKNQEVVDFGKRLKKHGIESFEGGRIVVAETPAAILQKAAMACGGTLIDDQGEPFIHDMYETAKIDYIIPRLKDGRQYAIFTQYIYERWFILDQLQEFTCGDDMDAFKAGKFQIFVGSIKSFCEGVDLAWMNGAMILYSLTFSGATYEQILNRMNKFDRVDPIKVHVLLIDGSIEEAIYQAVSQKKNFNNSFYKMVKNA